MNDSQTKQSDKTDESSRYRYSSDWIRKLESEEHWRLYWKQQAVLHTILEQQDSILEIGVGSGFTANYLRSKGHAVTTFDIDSDKNPDIVGNIVEHDFKQQFDHILAFEVFEHIPYGEFLVAIERLNKVCRKSMCISVPWGRKKIFGLEFKALRFKSRQFSLRIPKRKLWKHHFWEIDYRETKMQDFVNDVESKGFKIDRIEKFLMRVFLVCLPQ